MRRVCHYTVFPWEEHVKSTAGDMRDMAIFPLVCAWSCCLKFKCSYCMP